jgi:hypothetical protein
LMLLASRHFYRQKNGTKKDGRHAVPLRFGD